MILLSVGTQLPFDRLVRAVDLWAYETARGDVVGQIGNSHYAAQAIRTFPFVGPTEFSELQRTASVMISHAGMGSILTAMEYGKPLIIMPRKHELREHRNDHQIATVQRFRGTPGIHVADDVLELRQLLNALDRLTTGGSSSSTASLTLTTKLRQFIQGSNSDD